MLISVIRKGRASVSVYVQCTRKRQANAKLSVRSEASALQCERRGWASSSWFPQAPSSIEPELEHSVWWPDCRPLTIAGCAHSKGMPFISREGLFLDVITRRIHRNIVENELAARASWLWFCWNKSILHLLDLSGRFAVQSTRFYSHTWGIQISTKIQPSEYGVVLLLSFLYHPQVKSSSNLLHFVQNRVD